MCKEYHCGKNPNIVCFAATYGVLDTPCNTCTEWKQKESKETKKVQIKIAKEKIYIVVADNYYLRDTQILCPEGKSLPNDTETDDFFNMYQNDDNWKHFRQDAYLGYYSWPVNDVEDLKSYVAHKHGLDPMTLNAYPVEN